MKCAVHPTRLHPPVSSMDPVIYSKSAPYISKFHGLFILIIVPFFQTLTAIPDIIQPPDVKGSRLLWIPLVRTVFFLLVHISYCKYSNLPIH